MKLDQERNLKFLRRRDRLSVYIDILEAILEECRRSDNGFAKFTRVMYRANLSARRLKDRLLELSYLELIKWNEHGLKLTEKGRAFLREVKPFLKILAKYGVEVST